MSAAECETYNFTDALTSIKHGFTFKTQGSEAKLYFGKFLDRPSVLKERFVKKYRHPDLDKSLFLERFRLEVRAIARCHDIGVKCPALYFVDVEARCIIMEEIENAITVKEFLQTSSTQMLTALASNIGKNIAIMHKNDLMHGDLTTSNMLLKKEQTENVFLNKDFDLYLIDFGLSRRNVSFEDKAVDLYVLERALLSSHPNANEFNQLILKAYFENVGKGRPAIAQKLEEVRQRGRKRSMVG